MKIEEIRNAIDSLNWNRSDLNGATREEFIRMNVRDRLNKHIENVRALEINPRFSRDIAGAQYAIESALKMIEKWESMQPVIEVTAETITPTLDHWLAHATQCGIVEHIDIEGL